MESLEKKLAKTHKLGKLRDRLVLKLGYTGDSAIDSSVLRAVQLLDQLDPDGQLFRYAEVRAEDGGFAPSFEEYMEVDLRQIKMILSPAVEYLRDGVGGWVKNEIARVEEYIGEREAFQEACESILRDQYEADMRAEYESNMARHFGQ